MCKTKKTKFDSQYFSKKVKKKNNTYLFKINFILKHSYSIKTLVSCIVSCTQLEEAFKWPWNFWYKVFNGGRRNQLSYVATISIVKEWSI